MLFRSRGAWRAGSRRRAGTAKVPRFPSIAPTVVDGRHFFRVRFGPLASVEDADRLFNSLVSSGHNDARIVVE